MNSNQRSQVNNQSDNGGNEKSVSSSRSGVTDDKGNIKSQGGSQQQGGSQSGQQSTDRTGSQTGASQQQGMPEERQSNDLAGGMPRSPRGKHLAADEKMDDDTGLSNTANRQSSDNIDEGSRQAAQSNVGRRDDGTPD
jgi:hypothetical protein